MTLVLITPFLHVLYFPHKLCLAEWFLTLNSSPMLRTDCLFQELATEFSGKVIVILSSDFFRGVGSWAEGVWASPSFWKIKVSPKPLPLQTPGSFHTCMPHLIFKAYHTPCSQVCHVLLWLVCTLLGFWILRCNPYFISSSLRDLDEWDPFSPLYCKNQVLSPLKYILKYP